MLIFFSKKRTIGIIYIICKKERKENPKNGLDYFLYTLNWTIYIKREQKEKFFFF